MPITPEPIRAARPLLRLEQDELARQAGVSVVTIRRGAAEDGARPAAPATLDGVPHALEAAGAEFTDHGVRQRPPIQHGAVALLLGLQVISRESATRLAGQGPLTDDDLYDERGLPA